MSEGDCFVVAANLMLDDARLTLVHGQPTGTGGEAAGLVYWHAWCELDGMVIDRSNGNDVTLPAVLYYAVGNIDPDACRYYSAYEALAEMHDYGHYGPWDDEHPPM
jgi:hypothetical protein